MNPISAPSQEKPSTVTVINVESVDPYSSSGKLGKVIACVVGIILGAGMISLMGGFGTAGLLNNTGLVQYPQWLVNQINTIPNMYHNVMICVGYIGGVIAIAISSVLLYRTVNPEAAGQNIAVRKARLSKNDVGTNVNTDPAVKNMRPMTRAPDNSNAEDEGPKLVGEVSKIEVQALQEKDSQVLNEIEQEFMKSEKWTLSDIDTVEFQDKNLTETWKNQLTTHSTYIFHAYDDRIYDVIGRDEKGAMWVTEKVLSKDELKTYTTILQKKYGYTPSVNQLKFKFD